MKTFMLALILLICGVSASKYLVFMEVDSSNEIEGNESDIVENIIIPTLLNYKKDKQGINYKDCGIKDV